MSAARIASICVTSASLPRASRLRRPLHQAPAVSNRILGLVWKLRKGKSATTSARGCARRTAFRWCAISLRVNRNRRLVPQDDHPERVPPGSDPRGLSATARSGSRRPSRDDPYVLTFHLADRADRDLGTRQAVRIRVSRSLLRFRTGAYVAIRLVRVDAGDEVLQILPPMHEIQFHSCSRQGAAPRENEKKK